MPTSKQTSHGKSINHIAVRNIRAAQPLLKQLAILFSDASSRIADDGFAWELASLSRAESGIAAALDKKLDAMARRAA
jgi:hypothetical protein